MQVTSLQHQNRGSFASKTYIASNRILSCRSLRGYRGGRRNLVVRADRESGSFWSGVAIGGVVFGVLGFVFAPQISEALLGEDQRLRLPRFLDEEDDDPEVTKQNLAEKIAQLNSAIDDVSSQLKTRESIDEEEVTA
ncbi:hypothetical protein PSENEW3_00001698 [Picochlorum sp. SENEW3]|nr:hypothetical protein PSENEW3_00001698 [Picochlorum sp. SENEW3]